MFTKLKFPESVSPEMQAAVQQEFDEQLEAYGQKLEEAWLANDSLWQDPTGPSPLDFKPLDFKVT